MELCRRTCVISFERWLLKTCVRRKTCKSVTLKTLNPALIHLQYAVRGPIVARSFELEHEIKTGKSKRPFKEVIRANIGDAHTMGQKPLTFIRQVLACVSDLSLLKNDCYPADVKERAQTILNDCISVGAYSHSNGVAIIRKHVAEFIKKRDGTHSDMDNIVLATGASAAVKYLLSVFSNNPCGKQSGIMIPIPQYPLYTASLAELGLYAVNYYLDEAHQWGLSLSELERSLKAGSEHSQVRAIVIINPGNPTGQVLSRENIEMVFKFAHKHNLFIFADEVYQDNIYDPKSKFWSFNKIRVEMGEPYKNLELASFVSVSKGYLGECGLRGGWMEIHNMDPDVKLHLYKMISSNLCCSVLGQVAVDCYVRPPKSSEPSYELFCKEKIKVLSELKERAELISTELNKVPGIKLNTVQGAMYAFPRITLSKKAIKAAKKAKLPPDAFYAYRLLDEKGVCVVPGSGFGQKPGTWHFRTTILAQTPMFKQMLSDIGKFHRNFTKEFA